MRFLRVVKYLLILSALILGILWILDSQGNYEPWTVIALIIVGLIESFERITLRKHNKLKNDNFEAPQVIIPVKSFDLIARGEPGSWDLIVETFKNEYNTSEITKEIKLPLIVSYDISRIRKAQDYKKDIVFLDSSWLAHGNFSHWTDDKDMLRWLNALGEVSRIRAKKGLRTARTFYWDPAKVINLEQVNSIVDTIIRHTHSGIEVTLVEPDITPVFDAQLFSTRDAIVSRNFADLDLEQLKGQSSTSEVTYKIESINKLVMRGEALFFQLNESKDQIYKRIINSCPNIEGFIESFST